MKLPRLTISLCIVGLVVGCLRLPVPAGLAPGRSGQVPQPAAPGAAQLSAPADLVEQARAHAPAVPPILGSVDFPADRTTQAAVSDVVNAATVSFIDANANSTVASTVTNNKGGFAIALNGFLPELNTPYIVEAFKGLQSHSPGFDSPRFRTLVKWNGTFWESVSSPSIVISSLTTAVAIEAGLYPASVDPGNTMSKVNSTAKALNPTPRYGESGQRYSDAEILKLSQDIANFLQGDLDPVQSVMEAIPILSAVSTDSGKPRDIVEFSGAGFSPLKTANTVTFGGVPATTIWLATPTKIVVSVPAGAQSGAVQVKNHRGTTDTLGFTITATGPSFSINFAYPNQGTPGTDVTILGYGFSKTPADNTVYFDEITTTCITSDTSFCTCKVPSDAVKGPVSVKVGEGTSNTLPFTVLTSAQITAVFPTTGAPSEEVTIDGTNMGSSGAVTFNGVEARISNWTDTQVIAQVPTGTITGALKVTPAGRSTVAWGSNFTVLSGIISSWTTITSPNPHSAGGWFARKGKYLYASGGYSPYTDKTDRMALNLDGTAGTWSTLSGVSNVRHWHGNYTGYNLSNNPSIIGPYAYIYGGYDYTGGQQNSTIVQRARMFPDGSMSNFAVAPVTMATGRSETTSPIRAGDWVYLIGGHYCTDAIDAAKINPDGTLEPFNVVGRTPYSMYANTHAVVPTSNKDKSWLYLFGGYECNGAGHREPSRIYRVQLNPDGSLAGTFSDVGALPIHVYDGMAVIMGTNLYLFWGYAASNGSWTNKVYRTTINSDGDLGGWSQMSDMPNAHIRGTAIKVGSRIYVSGASSYNSSIDVATIQ